MAKETFNYLTPQSESGTGMMFPDWNNKEEISADLKSSTGGYSHTFTKTGWLYAILIPDPNSGSSSTWSGPDIDSWKVLQLNSCTVGKYVYAAGINREDVVLVPVKSGDVVTHSFYDNYNQTLSLLALHDTSHVYFIPAIYQAQPECVSYVIETGHNEDNTAFYRKYADGYIEQWGNIWLHTDNNGQGVIQLVIPFTNPNFNVSLLDSYVEGEVIPVSSVVFCRYLDNTTDRFRIGANAISKLSIDGETTAHGHINADVAIAWKACGY